MLASEDADKDNLEDTDINLIYRIKCLCLEDEEEQAESPKKQLPINRVELGRRQKLQREEGSTS